MRNVISTLLRRHLVASEGHLSSCSMAVKKIGKKKKKKTYLLIKMKILRQGTQHAQFCFFLMFAAAQTLSSDIMSSAPSTEPHLS